MKRKSNWKKTKSQKNYHVWEKPYKKGYNTPFVCAKKEFNTYVTFRGVGGHHGGTSIIGYSKNISNAIKKAKEYMRKQK